MVGLPWKQWHYIKTLKDGLYDDDNRPLIGVGTKLFCVCKKEILMSLHLVMVPCLEYGCILIK